MHLNGNKVPDSPQSQFNSLANQFAKEWGIKEFTGQVRLGDLEKLETTFEVRVSVYTSREDSNGLIIGQFCRPSPFMKAKNGHMHLDLTNGHFSLICKIHSYCHNWKCEMCENYSTVRQDNWKRHRMECNGSLEQKPRYSKLGRFRCIETIFDKLVKWGIDVQDSQRFCHAFTCWDLESISRKIGDKDPKSTDGMKFVNKQESIAASICSTVIGYTTPVCLRADNGEELVKQLLEYMLEISATSADYELQRMQSIFDQLEDMILEHSDPDTNADEDLEGFHNVELKKLEKLKTDLEERCRQHVFYSFNGG